MRKRKVPDRGRRHQARVLCAPLRPCQGRGGGLGSLWVAPKAI